MQIKYIFKMIMQQINNHKNKLLMLINNLINTQLVHEEIFINNEIKKESECLNFLLCEKQNNIMNQNNNLNPFMIHPNIMMNVQPANILPIQFDQQQIIQNNLNNVENSKYDNRKIFNIIFCQESGKKFIINCKPNEKVSDVIKEYREKSNDHNDNTFYCHNSINNNFEYYLNNTIDEIKTKTCNIKVTVFKKRDLLGKE